MATMWIVYDVSTHAPLRGATRDDPNYDPKIKVSTHAPLRGATLFFVSFPFHREGFNPRTPAGCDPGEQSGAVTTPRFNPRTPAGCDKIMVPIISGISGFNPRTPAGCD